MATLTWTPRPDDDRDYPMGDVAVDDEPFKWNGEVVLGATRLLASDYARRSGLDFEVR